jgi:type I restriction enzyme S subunit
VAKLEKLLDKVDACQQRLAKIPVLIKRFRQSILAAACSGRLTADWRENNPDSEEWRSVELLEVSERIQIGPFGTQLHKADYVSNGVPLINPTHIQGSKIAHDPEFSVSKSKVKELENYVLKENDIIMGRRGEMGRCALVSRKERGWLCGTGSLFVRPKSGVSPQYLFLILRSPETKAFLENESKGTTMSNLNLEILEKVPVFISSLAEQQAVSRRAEAMFALADQIEARYAKAKAHVEKLTQSILAKAFRGELVPQDPNDEPAFVLLERIRNAATAPKAHPARSSRHKLRRYATQSSRQPRV